MAALMLSLLSLPPLLTQPILLPPPTDSLPPATGSSTTSSTAAHPPLPTSPARASSTLQDISQDNTDPSAPPAKKKKLDSLKCQYCETIVQRTNEMQNHLRKDHGLAKLKCSHCTKEFISSAGLKVHLKGTHGIGTSKFYYCDYEGCDYKSNKRDAVPAHKMTEHGIECDKFECEDCLKKFSTRDNLKKHNRDGRCPGAPVKKKQLHKTIPCLEESCKKKFTTKVGAQGHYNTYHTAEGAAFICMLCNNKKFSNKQAYNYHEQHFDHSQNPGEISSSDTEDVSNPEEEIEIDDSN